MIAPLWYAAVWPEIFLLITIFLVLWTVCCFFLHESDLRHRSLIAEIQRETNKKINEEKIDSYTSLTQEMRTPVFLISAQIEELRNYTKTPVQIPFSCLDVIYRNSLKLNQLMAQLAEIHQADSSKKRLNLQYKNIVDFCNRLSEDYRHLCERKNITFRFFSDEDNIELYCDLEKLETVLTHLISNSFENTRKNGTVILELENFSDKVLFSVKNNNMGIGKKICRVLLKSVRYTRQAGYLRNDGIKRLVGLQGGTIRIEHERKKGSEYIFCIPKNPADKNGQQHEYDKKQMDKEKKKVPAAVSRQPENPIALHSILIIDKERDMVSLLERSLSSDYKIYKAYDGEEGLKMARTSLPDMIVCDLMMPKINGIELTQALKKDKKLQYIKVIIFTSKGSEEDMIKAFDCGADAYLVKPVSLKYLRMRMKKIIDQLDGTNHTTAITKNKNSYNKEEQIFLLRCREIIDDNLQNENFNIAILADKLAMSHSSLYKKIRAMTGMSLIEFINDYKIYKSVELFNQGQTNIDTVCEQCGFNDSKNFRELFKREMKMTPKQYVNSIWQKS